MSALAVVCLLLALIWLLDGLRMRARVAALPVLAPSDEPVAPEHRFLVRAGVELDPATARAASAFARQHGLEVLDLVPADLPSWRTHLLLQTVDPGRFRADRLARGRTAGEAMLVTAELLERAQIVEELPGDALQFGALAARLKHHACTSMDLAIAPSLRAGSLPFGSRGRLLAQTFGELVLPIVLAQLAFALAAPLLAFPAGLAALIALHLQSALATWGTALRPRDRFANLFLRTVADLASALTWFGGRPGEEPERVRTRRPFYRDLLAAGVERFFEPRRSDCPVCGGRALAPVYSVGDRYQFKPGRFTLERCAGCGHLFQNPRLSLAGLDFYYRDFYDGLGGEALDHMFSAPATPYLARARMLEGRGQPSRWLDVGAGHGHFCNVARQVWPDTTFEGLDLSESIEDAARRRWVDRGYRGLFPELAGSLGARFDVVSMSHYLEHTREPAAEIEAASRALRPGGFLLIEVPDPDSRMGRLLRSFWMPWFQPQHQHFLSTGNLERLLRANGFEPVTWHRGQAHQPVDLLFFTYLVLSKIARPIDLPWRPPTGLALRAWSRLVWWLGLPALVLGWLLDRVTTPLLRRPGWSNSYRVLARLGPSALPAELPASRPPPVPISEVAR